MVDHRHTVLNHTGYVIIFCFVMDILLTDDRGRDGGFGGRGGRDGPRGGGSFRGGRDDDRGNFKA